MHGIENFSVALANGVESIWRARSALARPSLFDHPAAARRSRATVTVLCILATLFSLAVAAGAVWLFWWAFTIHERR